MGLVELASNSGVFAFDARGFEIIESFLAL